MLDTGTRVAGYRIERVLGAGGMGTVYLAVQLSLNRPVALKMLTRELSQDLAFRARFAREGEVQAALDHPHIVPIYEAGDSENGLFLAMRYVRGSTLKELIVSGELDPERAIRLLTPVAEALDAAHAAGLIHRDIKPHNILVDSTEWPYLADFGLTRGGGSSGITRTGQLVGTFDYIAPEQVQGMPASPHSDQYALAAVLFECLAGEVPYPRDSDAALLYAQVNEAPPVVSKRCGEVPPAFDAVIERGMAKDPADRFASARLLMAAAQDALSAGSAPPRFVREIAEPPLPPAPPAKSPTVAATTPTPAPKSATVAAATPVPSTPPEPARGRETVLAPVSQPSTPTEDNKRTVKLGRAAIPIAAVAAAALAFAAGTALRDDGPGTRSLVAGAATLTVPGDAAKAKVPSGLGLDKAQAYALAGPGRAVLVTGGGKPSGMHLLPAGALADAAGDRSPDVVEIGNAQALRYDGVKLAKRQGSATVVALPTAAGTSVLLCSAETAAGRGACASALSSAGLARGAKPIDVVPPATYGRSLDRALRAYERDRRAGEKLLREAGRSASQARAARRLARAAGTLATAAAKLPDHPAADPLRDDLVSGARQVRSAANALATAASRRQKARYATARERLNDADRDLRGDVAGFAALRIAS